MDQRLAVLMCGLICFGIEATDVAEIHPRFDPITVALQGETLRFQLSVVVPWNQSLERIHCYCNQSKKSIYSEEVHTNAEKVVTLENTSSSDSGEYFCSYKTAKAYWVVLVRDEGYREPAPDNSVFICMGSLTAGLFLFSIIGSAVLCKDFRFCPMDSGTDGERTKGNRRVKKNITEESANAGSVYMGLERCTSSIYTTLDSAAPTTETNQKKVEQRITKESSKMQKTQKEEDVIESVYENY